ncbi:hypothetical protein [Sphingobacterium paramultivorum]|uniref:hypothetical protein n=1 Tax=Sphingobacterium paramultivorum TaxID=2886510 RepID=UPI00129CECAA|nr:hypothetical protein [Sphingobacterium paramultivorum]
MKKFYFLICFFFLFCFFGFAQQSPLPLVSKPTDNPSFYYNPTEGDDFRATRIIEARIGSDGDWYCLVEFEALSIKNRYPGTVTVGPYLVPGGGIYIRPSLSILNSWYKAVTGASNYAYNPSTENISNIFQYKTYARYLPTQKEGAFMWLKANYVSPTEIGLVNNPGNYSIPSAPANKFNIIYTIGVTVKLNKLENRYWYMQRGGDIGFGAPFDEVSVDLKITRPI